MRLRVLGTLCGRDMTCALRTDGEPHYTTALHGANQEMSMLTIKKETSDSSREPRAASSWPGKMQDNQVKAEVQKRRGISRILHGKTSA